MSYLTLKANDDSIESTFTPKWDSIGTGGMQYRAVGATEWTNATKGTAITVDTVGIELKADTIRTSNNYHFSMTGVISASGDVTSLTNGVGGDCVLTSGCYNRMFYDCQSLITVPALPSTTLANNCYSAMFCGCQNIESAPELPATTLADYCYYCMFSDCTSLTTAPPVLPATILAQYCYRGMFYNCTNLIYVPALPATILAESCYVGMFANCTSLVGYITPEPDYTLIHNFPTTPVDNWNNNMYNGINSTSTVPTTPSSNVNYYFKPVPRPSSVEGKVLDCIGYDQHSI